MQIAFSGRLGSGKSTVCAILKDKYGYEIYSTGTVQRKVAAEMGIDTLELNKRMRENPELDHIIDDAVVKLSRERAGDNIVYDSRMAWHFAENTFKVYMYVDPTVAGQRVFEANRGNVETYTSPEEATEKLMARSFEENIRFKEIYNVDNLDYKNYDLIIDSTSATPEEIAETIISEAEKYSEKPFENTKLMLSPYVLYPTKEYGTDDGDEIEIVLKNYLHFVNKGHSKLAALQLCGASMTEAILADNDIAIDCKVIDKYEQSANFTYKTRVI